MIKEIENYLASDLGLTPSNDGRLSGWYSRAYRGKKKTRQDVKKRAENAKVAVRNIRRDANDVQKMEGQGNIRMSLRFSEECRNFDEFIEIAQAGRGNQESLPYKNCVCRGVHEKIIMTLLGHLLIRKDLLPNDVRWVIRTDGNLYL